jgi:hypothetical protein
MANDGSIWIRATGASTPPRPILLLSTIPALVFLHANACISIIMVPIVHILGSMLFVSPFLIATFVYIHVARNIFIIWQ